MTVVTDRLVGDVAPPISGLRVRTLRDAGDYAILAELGKAANMHDGADWIADAETLRVDFENTRDLEPTRDVFIAEVEGVPVAASNVARQVRDGMAVYQTFGTVHPDWRRRGIGRLLLRTDEARIRELAAGFEDAGGRVYGSWAGDETAGARELLAAEGYVPVRYGFSMIRSLEEPLPDAALPDGLEIRDVRDEDWRRIFDADNEAFRDHWNHREPTEEDFTGMIALPDFDPRLWSVAWDGDEIAGCVMTYVWRTENETLGVRRGWLEHISVRRPWRRRGVARAIIADALRRLVEAGMNEAMLGVDAENPHGALGLYERLGFGVRNRGAVYRKAWEPGGRLV